MQPAYFKPADQTDIFPLTDTYWDDLRVPANIFHPIPAREPNWAAYKGGYLLEFTDEGSEPNEKSVSFMVQLHHTYKEGTSIYPHVHWVGEDNTAGDVYWSLSYAWANIFGVFPTETTIYSAGANSLVTDTHILTSFTPVVGTGKTISSMLVCKLTRNSSNVLDTFTSKSALILEVDFHIEIDAPGSRLELSK